MKDPIEAVVTANHHAVDLSGAPLANASAATTPLPRSITRATATFRTRVTIRWWTVSLGGRRQPGVRRESGTNAWFWSMLRRKSIHQALPCPGVCGEPQAGRLEHRTNASAGRRLPRPRPRRFGVEADAAPTSAGRASAVVNDATSSGCAESAHEVLSGTGQPIAAAMRRGSARSSSENVWISTVLSAKRNTQSSQWPPPLRAL